MKYCNIPAPILPTAYTEELSYGETLGKVITKVNECVDEVNQNDKKVDDLTNLVGTFDNRITENTNELANKVDKVEGKGLSTNDFTNADKAKVDAIPSNPKYTDTTYTAGDGINISNTNVISAGITAAGNNIFTGSNAFTNVVFFGLDGENFFDVDGTIQFTGQMTVGDVQSSGAIDFSTATVNVNDPAGDYDATNKKYVDNVLKLKAGLSSANTFTKANTFNGPIIANNSIALRSSASGTIVSVSDVSPLEHNVEVKASSAAVQVIRCGKNIFDAVNAAKISGGSSFTNNNGVITVSQNKAERWNSANVPLLKSLSGNKITITCKTSVSGVNKAAIRIQWTTSAGAASGNMIISDPDAAGNIKITGVVPNQPDESHNILCLMFYSNTDGTVASGTVSTATYSDIQIEVGSTATTYTPYQGQQTYTPEADGTVLGVTSLSPDMTLMTDTVGVVLDVTYNRDINAALAQLQQAILSLGGNV